MLGSPSPALRLRSILPSAASVRRPASLLWPLLVCAGVVCTGSHGALLAIAREHGTFTSPAVVLMQEMLKLAVCVAMVLRGRVSRHVWGSTREWLLYLVPACCYAVNNNIAVYLQTQMDAATFHVLCNFKILTTAVLYRALLHRSLSLRKWAALIILFLGSAVNTLGSFEQESTEGSWDPGRLHVTAQGLVVMLVYCLVSGFAGVYSERLMRQQMGTSMFEQGLRMYGAGVLVNAIIYIQSPHASTRSFFTGFSPALCLVIATQAANGLIFAYVMKHAGNILRLFVIAGAMVFATALSCILFHLSLSAPFILAIILITLAVALYHTESAPSSASKSQTNVTNSQMDSLPLTHKHPLHRTLSEIKAV